MKHVFLIIFFILIIFSNKTYSCEINDTTNNCEIKSEIYSNLFIRYIDESKNDSILILFKKWKKSCGFCEPLQRAVILFNLKEKTYNDKILDDSISCRIIQYLDRNKLDYLMNEQYFSYIPIGKEFDIYTRTLATSLISKYKKNTIEYLLCELYSNKSDSILIKAKRTVYKNSKIHNIPCDKNLKVGINKFGYEIALMSGIWIPTGSQTILGIHPEVGFQGGVDNKNFSFQFTLIIKFLKTANKYNAKRVHTNDSIESTNIFGGPYVGLDFGKTFFEFKRSKIQALAGLGFDAFTALEPLKDSNGRYEDVRSYNLNVGVGYRYYFKNKSYLGVEAKYNFVDYSLTGVTQLKGDFMSIRFIYGHIDKAK